MPFVSETFGLNIILILNSIYFSSVMLLLQTSVLHCSPKYFTFEEASKAWGKLWTRRNYLKNKFEKPTLN